MFTFSCRERPATGRSKARQLTRAALFAGLATPLVLAAHSRLEAEKPKAVDVADAPAQDTGPLAGAIAGMRYGLSPSDLNRYRHAFSAADNADWQSLSNWSHYLQDVRLMGHLLAQKYLAPEATPSFADLRAWMDLYGDLPEADDVYRLAQAKRPPDATVPQPRTAPSTGTATTANADQPNSTEPRTAAGERAFSRYFASDNKTALTEAGRAIAAVGQKASTSHWIAGLASWRMGLFSEAGKHFTALANSSTAAGWMQAAGAYWAGRVEERNGLTANATKWFNFAARDPTTFYGMLAMQKLGVDIAQRPSGGSLTSEHLDTLAQSPAGYRAIALLELDRRDLAAQELERIDAGHNPKLEAAIVMVADAARLGEISPNLAQRIARPGDDATQQFPIPRWRPRGGFQVDPALVYAVARQESRFNPKAQSDKGAVGLMQIMPRTASFVAPKSSASLLDPSTNLDVGQRVIRSLMQDPNIGENLLLLAVAYNRGPGNQAQFRQMLEHDDPLLAVESIPKGETRTFIEHVLANYWAYRARLNGDTTALSDLADGRWPLYRWDDGNGDAASSGVASNQGRQPSD
jgi:soluble lytic murein transglycosylase-like protein